MTFKPIVERLTVELQLNVLVFSEFENLTLRMREECSNRLRYRSGLMFVLSYLNFDNFFDFTIDGEGLQSLNLACLALIAVEQWGFFSVPHLLWHGRTLYNGHLRGPVTLKPVAERLAVELSLPVLTIYVCPDQGSIPDLPNSTLTLYQRGGHFIEKKMYARNWHNLTVNPCLGSFFCYTLIDNNNILVYFTYFNTRIYFKKNVNMNNNILFVSS